MSAIDEVLESYRDMFGVKTERANQTHRLACEELARLREQHPDTALRTAARPFVKDFPAAVLQDKENYPDAQDANVMDYCFPTWGEVRALAARLDG